MPSPADALSDFELAQELNDLGQWIAEAGHDAPDYWERRDRWDALADENRHRARQTFGMPHPHMR